ncbi:MAG: transposase domain-containing protein [Planctomycetota bacterium]|nr:transposase domain-containing protein [Planctomycetota bacterium]
MASAKQHQLDPWRYLRDLFTRLPRLTVSQLPELLPDRRQDSHPADRGVSAHPETRRPAQAGRFFLPLSRVGGGRTLTNKLCL